ncbi:MAG TPA: toll/interleukin-1 receptor domain-containing protein [Longimicrobiales bacterium]|nr:toll/interleukin-1 receptor domain-containing protein [Longimicrobiales bacterium]
MPVFISYSHTDTEFVDQLAFHLVAENTHVWVDRWEIHVGDSLRQKVETALGEAAAVLFILSPASVQSDWCQRELSAGLVRELEEKRVVVLPVLIKDCAVPLFLKDKLYADFRTDFDQGLRQVREALAKVTALDLGRTDEAEGHVDWATQWGKNAEGRVAIFATIVQQSRNQPYTVVSRVVAAMNDVASRRHLELVETGAEEIARQIAFETIAGIPNLEQLKILLTDAEPVERGIGVRDAKVDMEFWVTATCQRVGEDTGRDILVPIGSVLKGLAQQTRHRMRKYSEAERQEAIEILKKYRPDGLFR